MKKKYISWKYLKRKTVKVDEMRKVDSNDIYQSRSEAFKLVKLAMYAMRDKPACTCQEVVLLMCKYFDKEDSPMFRYGIHKQLTEFVEKGRLKLVKRGLYCLPKFELKYHNFSRLPSNPPGFYKRNAAIFCINSSSSNFSSSSVPSHTLQHRSSTCRNLFRGKSLDFSFCCKKGYNSAIGYLSLNKTYSKRQRSFLYLRGGPMLHARHSEHVLAADRVSEMFSIFHCKASSGNFSSFSSRSTTNALANKANTFKNSSLPSSDKKITKDELIPDDLPSSVFSSKMRRIVSKSDRRSAYRLCGAGGSRSRRIEKKIERDSVKNDSNLNISDKVIHIIDRCAEAEKLSVERGENNNKRKKSGRLKYMRTSDELKHPLISIGDRVKEKERRNVDKYSCKKQRNKRVNGTKKNIFNSALLRKRVVEGDFRQNFCSENLMNENKNKKYDLIYNEDSGDLSLSVLSTTCTSTNRRVKPVNFHLFDKMKATSVPEEEINCECVTTSSSLLNSSFSTDGSMSPVENYKRKKKIVKHAYNERKKIVTISKDNRKIRGSKKLYNKMRSWDVGIGQKSVKAKELSKRLNNNNIKILSKISTTKTRSSLKNSAIVSSRPLRRGLL